MPSVIHHRQNPLESNKKTEGRDVFFVVSVLSNTKYAVKGKLAITSS
jgi:hypothetical protein